MNYSKELKCQMLSEQDIDNILSEIGWPTIIKRVAETFTEEALGRTISPPKTILHLGEGTDYRTMPSYMEKYPEYCGSKIIGACEGNPAQGLPFVEGFYALTDAKTQRLLMVCGANTLTAYRTAVATAVAVRELASPVATTLGIIGCGEQAKYHIEAILAVREDISCVIINDLHIEKETDLINDCLKRIEGITYERRIKHSLLLDSDIVITLTPTKEPHIAIEDLPVLFLDKEILFCGIGGDSNKKIEFSPNILKHVDHYCDSYSQVTHTGLVERALKRQSWSSGPIIKKKDLKSLGDYMVGKKKPSGGKKKMFLSTGVALQDLTMAIMIYESINNNP